MDLSRAVYSRDLKIAAMRGLDTGSTTGEIARKYQVSPHLLERWRGEWRAKGDLAFPGIGKRGVSFSNYIAHSLIYGFVFYGYGFNLFDKLQRYQLYCVVLGMWIFSLIASPIWLAHYRFGPLEWCWRSLTYWKRQPMRLAPAPGPAASLEPVPEAAS
jgi:hypothetical protein